MMLAAAELEPVASRRSVAVRVATDADADAWERYVAAHPAATGYHSWGWQRVFENAFGHQSLYLIAADGAKVAGILPLVFIKSALFGRSLTSMAFLNYGGVVADDGEAADRLVEAARDAARQRGCHHVELRHVERQFPAFPCRQHKVTMTLPLQEGMWERLDRKVRNQIRKAQKSDLLAEQGPHLLNDFYKVFARNMRDLGTPVYSKRLFEEVLRAFPDRATIHVVRLGTQTIAAGLTYRTGTTVEVPWASSVREFNALCPNHLLYWSILESAVASGCKTLDFGRSTPNEGTYKFKEQWGATAVPLHWEYVLVEGDSMPAIAAGNPKYRAMVSAWKRLPQWLADTVGPSVVRGIP